MKERKNERGNREKKNRKSRGWVLIEKLFVEEVDEQVDVDLGSVEQGDHLDIVELLLEEVLQSQLDALHSNTEEFARDLKDTDLVRRDGEGNQRSSERIEKKKIFFFRNEEKFFFVDTYCFSETSLSSTRTPFWNRRSAV